MRPPRRTARLFAYSVDNAVAATGNAVSRSRLYELIKAGKIESRKVGRRRVILAASLHRYIATSPTS
jgi:excisionase family DNA binding protein